jgi:Short C-terminal domain
MGWANPLHLVFLVIFGAFWLVPSWLIAMRAERKGYSFWGFLLVGLFASWILELIIVLILDDRRGSELRAAPTDEIDQLERLASLHERGALSQEEFEARKTRLLSQER